MGGPPSVTTAVAAPSPSPSPSQPGSAPCFLTSFFQVPVLCACCAANICGTKYTCTTCYQVVDEACMQVVGPSFHCFLCTCRACGSEVSSHTIECKGCHFRVHAGFTTDGICTRYTVRVPPSNIVPKPRKFKPEWFLLVRGCGMMPCVCSCGVPLVVHIRNLGTQFRSSRECPIFRCGPLSTIRGPAHTVYHSPYGSRVGVSH